jgi:hypothetical protein
MLQVNVAHRRADSSGAEQPDHPHEVAEVWSFSWLSRTRGCVDDTPTSSGLSIAIPTLGLA